MNRISEQPSIGGSTPSLSDLGLAAICLSPAHAAMYMGLSPAHGRRIQRLGQQGRVPRLSVGRAYVFPVEGLTEFVQQAAGTHDFYGPSDAVLDQARTRHQFEETR
jgi:hypothetical protein